MAKNTGSKSALTGNSIRRSAATGRFVTTRANQKAAARVMIAASRKAKLDVPARVTKIADAK